MDRNLLKKIVMKEIKDPTRKPFWIGFMFFALIITAVILLLSCKKEEPQPIVDVVNCKCGIITEIHPVYQNGFWSHDNYFARNDCSKNVRKIFMGQYLQTNEKPMVGAWVCINEEW